MNDQRSIEQQLADIRHQVDRDAKERAHQEYRKREAKLLEQFGQDRANAERFQREVNRDVAEHEARKQQFFEAQKQKQAK